MNKYILLIIGVLCGLLSACSFSSSVEVKYNPYVEAFTSGEVSRFVYPTIVLAENIPTDKIEDWKEYIRISPSIEGSWSFDRQRTFVFKPARELERDIEYKITLDLSNWWNIQERRYREFTTTFHSVALQVRADQISLDMNSVNKGNYDINCAIYTSDREVPETVELLIGVNEKLDFHWQHSSDGRKHLLTIKNIVSGKRSIKLFVRPNKWNVPEDDLLQIEIPDKEDFSVYKVNYVREPEHYIEVMFTQSLDENQTFQGLAYLQGISQNIVTVEDNKLRLYPEMENQRSMEVVLKSALKDKQGRTLGKDINWPIQENEGLPAVRFIGDGVILPQSTSLNVPFQAIGLKGVIVRVLKIGEQNIGQFLQTNQLDQEGELMRVGRLLTRQVIFLDDKSYDLKRWNTFALDLKQLITPEQGAIYRVILSFDESLSVCTCSDKKEVSKEKILADNELAFKEELSHFDEGGWYYQVDANMDWSVYRYQDRNDPCKPSYYFNKSVGKNILVTNIGLIAMSGSDNKMIVLAHHLQHTKPMEGVLIQAYNYQQQLLAEEVTDKRGFVFFDLRKTGGQPFYLLASKRQQRSYLRVDDVSALSLSTFDVEGEVLQKGVKGFIYGERGIWRPGDTLHLGFMLCDKGKMLPKEHPVKLELYNPLGQLYVQEISTEGVLGLYTFSVPTETDILTGGWTARVEVGGVSFEKRLRIESIKPNRLKIQLKVPECMFRNEILNLPLHVEWLQGAKAKSLKYDLKGTFVATNTTFVGFEDYQFVNPTQSFDSEESQLITGNTDSEGNAIVQARLQIGATAPGMLLGSLATRVYEESGDFSIDAVRVLYSPYKNYVGIRSPQQGNEPLSTDKSYSYQLVSVDYQGTPIAHTYLSVDVYKVDRYWWWSANQNTLANYVSDSYHKPVKHIDLQTNAQGMAAFSLSFSRNDWGTYLILAKDKESGHTTGLMSYYDWPDLEGRRDRSGTDNASVLTFKTDKKKYRLGETIKVTIPSSEGSRAIVSVQTGAKVLSVEEFVCNRQETSFAIPVTKEMQPNAYLFISLLQPYGLTQNDLPIRMYGVVPFEVIAEDSHLFPQIRTAVEWKPESVCRLTVSEENRKEMAYTLAIVDEGLLDLTHFQTPNPWSAFHTREALGVHTWDLYNYVLGAYGGRVEQLFSIGGDDALNKGPKAVVNRFTPVVRFMGPFILKAGERKNHVFEMPNYNGRVRVMVVATNGEAFGNVEKSVMVRKPVMLLGTLPRVIGTNEEIVVPATVFATEDHVGDVQVSIQTSPEMEIIGNETQQIHFETKDDCTVSFRVKVKGCSGKGRISLVAKGKGEKSTYTVDLEIRSVSTKQVSVLSEVVKPLQTWKQEVALKGVSESNQLYLEISRIKPLNLTARLSELIAYPHDCLEQIVSKAFPQLYLSQFALLTDEQAAASEALVKQVVSRLRSYQTASGSFAYWAGRTDTNAWGTIYALHFLLVAESQGYVIPSSMKQQALADLRRIASGWKVVVGNAAQNTEMLIQAYRLYVLALAGHSDIGAMNRLKVLALPQIGKEMLALAYTIVGRADVADSILSQTRDINDVPSGEFDETFGSELRNSAIRLWSRCALDKEAEVIPLANGLSEKLSSEEWLNTQETSFAIIALAEYYKKYRPIDEAMNFSYQYQDMQERVETPKALYADLLVHNGNAGVIPLQIRNEGNMPLYLQVKTEGDLQQESIPAAQNGLKMTVDYQTTDGQPLAVSSLEQGMNFRALVTIQNPTAQALSHLVLTTIFPSGWEILNSRFLPTASATVSNVSYQDIRDDRAYSYIDYLPSGSRLTVCIDLYAAYSGRFYLPPIVCEAMYNQTIRANTSSNWVEVRSE